MLAKMTAKNQFTLPKTMPDAVGATDYFDAETRNGQIILRPVRIQRADAVRAKLADLKLSADAVDLGAAGRRFVNERSRVSKAGAARRGRY